ncbi:MAG: hypothetical protein QM500_06875, partial [Methylococcales bacterium]
MGTSQSSNGSPSGVPMVPPWVPDLPMPERPAEGTGGDTGDKNDDLPSQDQATSNDPKPVPLAPTARFDGARRSMGDYARTGDGASMRKGLGKYVKKGYGGSSTATRRMAGTAQTAQTLNYALAGGSESPFSSDGGALEPRFLAGKTAYEVMDAVVEAVRPVDGTQDTEACRESIKDALADVLDLYPNADLTNLSDEQRSLAIERFVAADVFRRIDLDLGKHIREKSPNAVTAMGRLKEVREYVRETVTSAFKKLKSFGNHPSG